MRSLPNDWEGFYDATGRHIGGTYPPIMVDGVLTDTHTEWLATRPVSRLIWHATACANPQGSLGLVWMAPPCDNPLAASPNALSQLVYVLDAGYSVNLHAASYYAINLICGMAAGWVGGGHV